MAKGCAVLHAFNWRFSDVAAAAEDISKAGYYAVLLSCPLYSSNVGDHVEWCQVFQPKDLRVILSHLGDKQAFTTAIDSLHRHQLKVYVDFVINHMADERRGQADYLYYPGNAALVEYKNKRGYYEKNKLYGNLDHGIFSPQDFYGFKTIVDDTNIEQVTSGWLVDYHRRKDGVLLPDMRDNSWVKEQQRMALMAMADLGVDGFRIDALKHITLQHAKDVLHPLQARGIHVFGEILIKGDNAVKVFMKPYLETTDFDAYDFPLFFTLRSAFSFEGDLSKLLNLNIPFDAVPNMRAVTFAVNHDIPLNISFREWLMHPTDEYLSWVFLFGRDGGMPLLFSDNNITDNGRWYDTWKRPEYMAMVRFHNAVQGQFQYELWCSRVHIAFRRGDMAIVCINKSEDWQDVLFDSYGLRLGAYRCVLGGHVFDLVAGQNKLSVPPRSAQMWLHKSV